MPRSVLAFALLVVVSAAGACAAEAAEEIPEPRVDRIDYAHPEKYVALPKSLGKRETIEKIAGEIQGASPREKLGAIGPWIDAHMRYDATTFARWRDVDALLAQGTYGGCADHAELYGGVARACGIPTVWVKSLDLDWIAWFRSHPDQPKNWYGHVFLEVHVDGAWRLFDAGQGLLYADYDVKQRILPGHRLAYDKGADPYELVLSTRWELWKKQTRRFVETLDLAFVPVGEATSVKVDPPGRVYVAATHPAWQWAVDRCQQLGLTMGSRSGNGEWERWLPNARRGILIVPCAAGTTVLPETYWPLLPVAPPKQVEALGDDASQVVRRKADDGTDVVLVMARDEASLRAAIAALTLEGAKSAAPPAERGAKPNAPVPGATKVYVAANSPEWSWIVDRCRKLGMAVGQSGNAAFERWMPESRSGILVVTSIAGETVLPAEYATLLPASADEVRALLVEKPSAVVRRKAADGADVVLLAARDKNALRAAVDAWTLDAPK